MSQDYLDVRNRLPDAPQMIHLGYACDRVNRVAKIKYYEARGEAVDPKRKWYTESRAMWENWKPGMELPRGAKVIPYTGPIPEILKES